jgi:hypothetical protein
MKEDPYKLRAFPMAFTGEQFIQEGMLLRDYFATQIASGMAAFSGTSGLSYGPDEIAGRSYQVADAMLKARDAVFKGNE